PRSCFFALLDPVQGAQVEAGVFPQGKLPNGNFPEGNFRSKGNSLREFPAVDVSAPCAGGQIPCDRRCARECHRVPVPPEPLLSPAPPPAAPAPSPPPLRRRSRPGTARRPAPPCSPCRRSSPPAGRR